MNSANAILLATTSEDKLRELSILLGDAPYSFVSLNDLHAFTVVEETGSTFEENAILKASQYAKQSSLLTIADDSGLEVDALDGQPGIFSKRFAGPNATDKERNQSLLEKMLHVPWNQRTAKYRCTIAIASPSKLLGICTGFCYGIIERQSRGEEGFGYDPIFFIPELGRTMAELRFEEKNQISHRFNAAQQALKILTKPQS